MRHAGKSTTRIAALVPIALVLTACQRDLVLVRPGAPVVVTEAAGKVRLSAWDSEAHALSDLGWVDAKSLVGLTATDYDWSSEQ